MTHSNNWEERFDFLFLNPDKFSSRSILNEKYENGKLGHFVVDVQDFIRQERKDLLEGIISELQESIEPTHSQSGATTDEDDSLKLIGMGISKGLKNAISIVEKHL